MKHFSLTRGPSIEVNFHVSSKGIEGIDFHPINEKGLTWNILGQCSLELNTAISEWMNSYGSGKEPKTSLPLIFKKLPPYRSLVFSALQRIPFGKSLSYKELAILTGNPKASRAVGNSCGSNPFPLIIPCHRVLSHNKGIGGFSSDIEVKKRLLNFEKITY